MPTPTPTPPERRRSGKIRKAIKKWTKFSWERDAAVEEELTPLQRRNREAAGWKGPADKGGREVRDYGSGDFYADQYGGKGYSDFDFGDDAKYGGYGGGRFERGGSYSSRWSSRWDSWGGFGSWATTVDPNVALLTDYMNKLARTANVVLTAEEQERPMLIKWVSKEVTLDNDPFTNVIALSPDTLIGSEEDDRGMVLDALIGQVLTLTGMKRTARDGYTVARDYMARNGLGPASAIGNLWTALEMIAARTNVLSDWPGFLPYFVRQTDMIGAKKASVEEAIKKIGQRPYTTAYAAASLLIWNTINPHDAIEVPASLGSMYAEADGIIKSNPNRFTGAKAAILSLIRASAAYDKGDEDFAFQPDDVLVDTSLTYTQTISGEYSSSAPPEIDITSYTGRFVANSDGTPSENLPIGIEFHESTNRTTYETVAKIVEPISRRIAAALRFRNQTPMIIERGLPRGTLDDGSLDKLVTEKNPHVWEERKMAGVRDVAFGILLDESGSMANKIDVARMVIVTLVEALRATKGVHLMVLGHSANTSMRPRGWGVYEDGVARVTFRRIACAKAMKKTSKMVASPTDAVDRSRRELSYSLRIGEYMTAQHKNPWAIMHAVPSGNNLDGYAIEYAVRKMELDYPNCTRVLFVVSDGQPAGCTTQGKTYGQENGCKHVKSVCEFAKSSLNVSVFGIGVCMAYSEEVGDAMYGQGRYIVIDDVASSGVIMGAFMTNVCRKL